jgi:hypothetical protein
MVEALKDRLITIAGVGTVDVQSGLLSPWVATRHPVFHWLIDIASIRQKRDGIAGNRLQFTMQRDIMLVLDGWYPVTQDGTSIDTWRLMIDSVIQTIEDSPTWDLALTYAGRPAVTTDDYQMKSSLNQGDLQTLCHYCRINVPVIDFYDLVIEDE